MRHAGCGMRDARRVILIAALLALSASRIPLLAQRPNYQQQMRDNQQRLEGIRRERSEVEQELARLRTQAHSLSDEIANIERQKSSTNRIVNELDRQITGLSGQIDQITVDLLIAQDALLEKRAVLERRLVDIYKRGSLYSWQVLFAAESFGDLLSRYKYLYLVSRQDRLLTNDMHKLRDRVARQRQLLVDSREALARRRRERTDELGRYLESFADTALAADELERHIRAHRSDGQRVVLTNGCFDVLHRGHTRYLNQAKQLGDILVVALNSDDSVRKLKGPDRPINSVADRAAVIAALSCVDYVTVFDTPTPIPLIEQLRPEIYAKGGDYTPEMLAETEAVEAYGGTVTILDYVAERSTTAMVQRIRNGEGAPVPEA